MDKTHTEDEPAPVSEEQQSQRAGEVEEAAVKQLPVDMFYDYAELESKASISPESEIPVNLLHLSHSFGYDCKRRCNLQLLDEQTLVYVAGNILVLQDLISRQQRYLRSSGGGGIGAITAHPSKQYFAVGEKGSHPNIIIYEYPSLRPYRILRGGTEQAYCHLDFSADGELLASVGAASDYMLTLWDWRQEEVMLRCKAVSQDVYRVSFSPHTPGLLTSCGSGHIKFWEMASTFTGLKLQGLMGHFGKTAATDIESYVVLPDGKVVSGSDWGNLLLWDGNFIKVEICRKEGHTCHAGTALPFAMEEGQLLTIGADGAVRGWNLETIDGADSQGEGSRFELEPMNELVLGHGVSLSSMVRSGHHDSFIWYGQDAMGAIWKLDLSFTHTTPDPECLFQFHCGAIQGMDVSRSSHLMATTALGRSVRVFDFLSKKELTTKRFNRGGTALCWAPPQLERGRGLLAVGFEDGVVRLLDVFDSERLQMFTGRSRRGEVELCLQQAFKPHSTSVSAVAYDHNADVLATASSDCTVFFFSVREKYRPVGFVRVPGPVQALEWSPHSHSESRLLVLCCTGHVLEVQSPDLELSEHRQTYELSTLFTRAFCFKSIKSHIQREKEMAQRQALKEKNHIEREEQFKQTQNHELKPEIEPEKEELPPNHLPSPLCCGFYSQPGRFWLSMGGYDAGFLYHCEFSEDQGQDPAQRQDEPFKALPLHNAEHDPIVSVTFSSEQCLLLCGMTSGSLRVYPLSPGDHSLESMHHYWNLSIHDNTYGALRHLRVSHDELFVLTAGDDGNIFSFSLLPPAERPQHSPRTKKPSPRTGLEHEEVAQDIEDPSAYSIEMAKQMLESDRERREAEQEILKKRRTLGDLQNKFRLLLSENQALPSHVRLQPQELCLDMHFVEQMERVKAQRLQEVQRQQGWQEEHSHRALEKLHNWFKDSSMLTVAAIESDHRVSTYRLPSVHCQDPARRASHHSSSSSTSAEVRKGKAEPGRGAATITEEEVLPTAPLMPRPQAVKLADRQVERLKKAAWEEVLPTAPLMPRPQAVKLTDRQVERLKKAAEKAEQARMKIQKRKEEWAQIYMEKPDEDYEDPRDVQAIQCARDTVGDRKLKSSSDIPKQLRVNAERKREELSMLQEAMRCRQTEMNTRIIALRDAKLQLVARLHTLSTELQRVQRRLPAESHLPCPALPHVLPEETPEMRQQYTRATLLKYKQLRDHWATVEEEDQDGASDILQQLEKNMTEGQHIGSQSDTTEETTSQFDADLEPEIEGLVENTDMEKEQMQMEQIRLLHQLDSITEQMQSEVWEWDATLRMILHEKLALDQQLKLADLRQLTLLQELLLFKQSEGREESLQSKLSIKAEEEKAIMLRLEELKEQLESKLQDIIKLQEREEALTTTFIASLGDNNKFEEFLTRVFNKKIKRIKKKTAEEAEQEADSEEDEESDDEDEDDADMDEGGAPLDDSVCPPNCEPALFEYTLQLRERKLDLQEQLQEARRSTEALKKDCETLTKKGKSVSSSCKAVEYDLELMDREKQRKMNELDVVVPLCLHQMELVSDTEPMVNLSQYLVLERTELQRLQDRIPELQREKGQQRQLFRQARQQYARLLQDNTDMKASIQVLEARCNDLMMKKFGRIVDLEALQTLSGNRVLEELKQDKLLRDTKYAHEIHQWDLKVGEAQEALMNPTKSNTETMRSMIQLHSEKKDLEQKMIARQKTMGTQLEDSQSRSDRQDIVHLQEVVRAQAEQAAALTREIQLLSRKGGHILPPGPAPQPTGPSLQSPLPRTSHT